MVSGVSSLCQMVSGGCLCREILSRYFHISLGVVRSLPYGPRGLAVRPEGKICFSHFTLLEWNVKNCFVKLIKTHVV